MLFSTNKKIADQQGKRNWSDSDVQDVLDNPALTLPAIDYSRRGTRDEKATVYYRQDGHYVIRNNTTAEIVQVSNRYNDKWRDEHRGGTVRPVS